MKLLRNILFVLVSIFLIASIILWMLARTINPETIKSLVSNQITAVTNKKTVITGAISWQLFPKPGLKFKEIQIGEAESKQDYHLSMNHMVLQLKLSPLFHGQFVFSQLDVDRLKLHLDGDAPYEKISRNQSSPGYQSATAQFAIEKLKVKDGEISISKHGNQVIFRSIQASAQQFNLKNQLFSLQAKAQFADSKQSPTISGQVNFKGRFSLLPDLLNKLPQSLATTKIDGQLSLQNIIYHQYLIKKINTTVKTFSDRMQFNPLTLSLYKGESLGDLTYHFATEEFSLNQTATNLDGRRIIAAFLGKDALSGIMDYSIHATIPTGNSGTQGIRANGNLTIKDGEIRSLNLDQMIHRLTAKINNLMSDKKVSVKLLQLVDWDKSQFTDGNTPFKLCSFQFQAQDGIVTSQSIILQSDKLLIKGSGNLQLLNHQLKANLQARISSNSADLSLQLAQQLLGGYFPLEVSGTLEQPLVLPDFKIINSLHALLMKSHLEKPITEIKNTIQELMH